MYHFILVAKHIKKVIKNTVLNLLHLRSPDNLLLRELDELKLYQSGSRYILCFNNGTEQSFDCLNTAIREMLYAFFQIIEKRNQKFIS